MVLGKVELALLSSGVYMAAMVVIGVYAARRSRSFLDYAVAGRKLGFLLVYATILATWFGTGLAIGGASMAYSYGFRGVIMDPIGAGLSILIFGLFFAGFLRSRGYITIADYFRDRYGKGMEQVSAIVQVLAYMGWSASLLVTFGTILDVFTGLTYKQGLIIGVLVTVLYTSIGGLWSVVITDFIQAGLLIIGILALFIEVLRELGGPTIVFSQLSPSQFSILPEKGFGYLGYLGFLGAAFYISSWLVQGLGAVTSQDLVQRAGAARDEGTARKAALAASISYIILGLIPATIGVIATLVYPNLDNPDQVLPRIALDMLPTVPFILFTVGLLAALMSSADSAILVPSVVVAENIAPRLGLGGEDAKLRVARVMVPVVSLLALLVALDAPKIYMLMNMSWELILMTHTVPFIAGVVSERPSERGVVAAVVAGLVLWIALTVVLYPVTFGVEGVVEYAIWDAIYIAAPVALVLEALVVAGVSFLGRGGS